MKKSQTSIEAALVITFMIFVLAIFLGIMLKRSIEVRREAEQDVLLGVGNILQNEIDHAQKSEDGYSRDIILPSRVSGIPYNLTFFNSTQLNKTHPDHSELVINAIKYRKYLYIVENLAPNVLGDVCNYDDHIIRIRKINKTIYLSCIET